MFEYGFTEFQNVEVKGNETRFGQSEDSFFVSRDNLFGSSNNLMELTDSYVTIPTGSSLDLLGYELTFLENDENGHMACIKYKIGDAYLGQAILKLNVDDEDKDDKSPYKKEETETIKKQEELPINVYKVIGLLVIIVVLVIIIKIIRKTSGKRKAKRARKKLFKVQSKIGLM